MRHDRQERRDGQDRGEVTELAERPALKSLTAGSATVDIALGRSRCSHLRRSS